MPSRYIKWLPDKKNGEKRCQAGYADINHKWHRKNFRRKIDAQQWLDSETTSQLTGLWADPKLSRGKVATQAATWLASHPEWTESTRARNEHIVNKHILPRWGNYELKDVSTEEVQAWVGTFTVSAGTIRKNVGVLSGIMDSAVIGKRLAVNPVLAVKRPKQKPSKRRYLNARQVEDMARAAGDFSDVVLTLAYCGLRFGELAALRVGAVSLERRRLTIEASVTEVKGHLAWSSPKDNERRSVPFPQFLEEPIAARMAGRGPEDLVFTAQNGGPLRINNIKRDWFNKAASEAGIDHLTPHELRHTCASLAVAAGASVLALQRMLGHAKPSITLDTYSDLFDEDLDAVAEKLATVRGEVN